MTSLMEQQYVALNEWFYSPLGRVVAEEFTQQFQPVLDYLKGDTLLQLGACGENSWLDALNYSHKWIASVSNGSSQLRCCFNQIPVDRNSLDCVIVPLTLEPFIKSSSMLDEIDRILKPMGYLVFLNINPWSLWSVALKLHLLDCFADQPIKIRSSFILNRILLQRGYKQCSLTNFCYLPPMKNTDTLKKFTLLNELGKILWPFPSGFYCYIAQKYEPVSPNLVVHSLVDPIKANYNASLQPALD